MNIVFLTPIFYPAHGGAAEYFKTLLFHLNQERELKKISLITQYTPLASSKLNISQASIYRILLPRHTIEFTGKIYNSIVAAINVPIVIGLLIFFRLFLRYEIVHCHSGELFLHGRRNALLLFTLQLFRYRIVCDVRDLLSVPDSRFFGHSIIAASETIAEKVRQLSIVNPVVIPVPLELPSEDRAAIPSLRLLQLPDRPFLVYMGNVAESKGVRELVTAWKESSELYKKFDLVIAGPFFRTEEDLLRLLRSDERIHMIGAVEHEVALEVIQLAAVLVVPSPNEGLPRVCLEAIAVGTPPVCHASVRELHETYPQFTYQLPSPGELASAILTASNTNDLSDFDIAKYSAEQVPENYLPVYRSLFRAN